tara:strand:+ start:1006 stop:4014 length:3009 start_codon:yes stop_codon:yes gene_type:complete
MCGFITDIVDSIVDIVTDVVDIVVDVVEDVVGWLTPEVDIPDFSQIQADQNARGVLVNKISANSFISVVYGTRKVGGNIVFLETSGTDNQYLYMALVLSEGEIDSISSLFVNDNLVTLTGSLTDSTTREVASTDSNFFDGSSLIQVQAKLGADDQTACSVLTPLSSWTTNHRLRGLAYLALRFTWNADKFGSLPTVQAIIKGKKVYNPNLDSTVTGGSGSHRKDTSSTWEYSDNPIYQLLDYLRNDRFGMGIVNSYFDSNFADWQVAGDVCDTNITPFSGASQIDLMDSHTVVDTSKKAIDNVKDFVRGSRAYLNFTGGKYNILVESTGSASITLTEDNIIGGITVQSKNKNSRYNRVVVSFINPDKNFQSDTAQFPPVDETGLASADQFANMQTADGGLLLEGRFDFSMFTSPYQAQEMAEIILRRSRSSLDISLRADATALDLAIGDIVNVTHATPSFSAKPFRVQGMTINADHTVNLQCSEHQDSFYTFGTQQEVATIPDTTLPNPFSVQPPASITLDDELVEYADGIVITRLLITIGASPDQFVDNYEVQIKQTLDPNGNAVSDSFREIAVGKILEYQHLNVIDGATYQVRVRAVNTIGSKSTFISTTRTIIGGVDAPSNVEDFAVELHGQDHLKLTWTPPSANSDLDISFYEIRYQNVTTGANWLNSTNLVRCPRRKCDNAIVPARVGSYLIKAVDKNGNTSAEATIISTNISGIQAYQQISTFSEIPNTFTALDQMDTTFPLAVKIDASGDTVLTLDTVTDFDDTVGNFDSPTGDFELGGTDTTSNPNFNNSNRDAKGFYNFINSLSLPQIYDGNVEPTITLDAENPYDLFDSGRGALFFDSAKAPFDGTEQIHAFHRVQIATSTTSLADCTSFGDISQSATFKFKFAKFRLKLTNDDSQTSSNVKQIDIKLNMEERTFAENDLQTSSGSKTITYTNPFFSVPAIGVSAQNMTTGDVFTISSKTVNGFTIAFTNSSGSAVDRTFDYIAKGFGLQST